MLDLAEGIRRVTFPLPLGIDHVHCYLLRGPDGWTLVDAGLGLPGSEERWAAVLAELDAPLVRIVITHFHPDHVGGGADVAALAGAPVLQGALDYEQCARVWGQERWPNRVADHFLLHGLPADEVELFREQSRAFAAFVRFAHDPQPLREGDRIEGWEVVAFPGHADGHLCLLRDGVMIAGDHLLPKISPTVGLYPEARPDPLGDYLASLERAIELNPAVAYPGHGDPIRRPAARARELIDHHRVRLEATAAALGAEPLSAYDVSLELFGRKLEPSQRRFALAETLAHLERLVLQGGAERAEDGGSVAYTAL